MGTVHNIRGGHKPSSGGEKIGLYVGKIGRRSVPPTGPPVGHIIRVFEKLAEGKFPERILREEREEEEEVVRKLEGLSTGVEEDGSKSESGQQAGNATADANNDSEKTETLSAHYFGWGLSSLTENLDDEVFVKGYVELWKELVRIDKGREGIVR